MCIRDSFFVEFEEIPDISEEEEALLEVTEDPYAWAKAKQTPTIPQQEAAPAEQEQQAGRSAI